MANASDLFSVDQPNRWYDLNASHHEKHAVGGAVIGAATYLTFQGHSKTLCYEMSLASGTLVGFGYEFIEAKRNGSYRDPVDAAWVIAGAGVGAITTDFIGRGWQLLPQPKGFIFSYAKDF